jgi:malonyl CoA-acyl carrier protein transacylase
MAKRKAGDQPLHCIGGEQVSLPARRGLGKAKITDRIYRIDKIYIKNPDNPVNPVENRHEKFFVSGTEEQVNLAARLMRRQAAQRRRRQ